MASSANKDIIHLILRYLENHNLFEAARSLERESGMYFNMSHFENLIKSDKLDEAEKYFNCFTSINDNLLSARVFFLLRHLKFLQAINDDDILRALRIAKSDLTSFDLFDTKVFERACRLLALEEPRDHPMMIEFDKEEARKFVAYQTKNCIMNNPIFDGKLESPPLLTAIQQLFSDNPLAVPPSTPEEMVFFLNNDLFNGNRDRNGNNGGS